MNRRTFAVVAALLLPLASTRGGPAEPPASDQPIVIGMPSVFTGAYFHAALYKCARDEAEARGAKLIVTDAMANPAKQSNDLKEMVTKGARGIVISPMDGITPAIEEAARAGVAVVTVDSKLDTDKVLFHSGVDNVEVGRMAARFVIDRLKNKGSVLEIEGWSAYKSSIDRKAGFDEVIKSSGVKLLASMSAFWDRNRAKDVMNAMMKANPDFDAVFAANDEMILGAIDAMSAAGIDPSTKVTIGVDGVPFARESIKAGKLTATIDYVPEKQARQAVDYLVRYLKEGTRPPQRVMLVQPELLTRVQQ